MISVSRLTRTIDTGTHQVEILKNIDLEIPSGQFAAIMGPSGSGKSTLLGLLAGLDSATSGSILLDGIQIVGLPEDELAVVRGRKIGFVFQSYNLIPTLTAEENILLPAELQGLGSEYERRGRELLDRVGLSDRRDHYPVQLSGGEQQRVALARAFLMRCRRSCLRTNPQVTSTVPTGSRFSICCSISTSAKVQPWCWSRTIMNWPNTPHGASR